MSEENKSKEKDNINRPNELSNKDNLNGEYQSSGALGFNEESRNRNENDVEYKKNSRVDRFIWGFLMMQLPYIVMFFSYKMFNGYGVISGFFLAILFLTVGTVLWAVVKNGFKKRRLALGFLIGGAATLLVMFVFTGGCGMFIRI